MEPIVLFGLVLLLLLIGTPIAVSLGLSSLIIILFFSSDSLASISLKLFEAMEHYTLLAIPFFILSSAFMSTGGVAKRIIRFAIACVGHMRGGLAIASVFACMLFAALSGSSPATVVAIGTIVIAGMRQVGYTKEFAAGVICNAGTLGILIPPSIVMVVYAAATDVSVGRMFMAGVIPGLLAGLMLMGGIYVAARIKGLPAQPWAGFSEMFESAGDAFWGLLLIVIILGGIYGGVFTPTEAAAVAAVYAFVIALFVYRDMGPLMGVAWRNDGESLGGSVARNLGQITIKFVPALFHRDTQRTLVDAGKVTLMLMFIIANATALRPCPDHGTHSTGDDGSDHRCGLRTLDLPDHRQPAAACGRSVHGTLGSVGHRGTGGLPDRNRAWHRSHPSGHHHGGQYGDRHDHTTRWPQSFRHFGHHGHAADAGGEGRPALAVDPLCIPDPGDLRPLDLDFPSEPDVRPPTRKLTRASL